MFRAEPKADAKAQTFVITEERGAFLTVARDLKEDGLIKNVFWFRVAAKLTHKIDAIQAGSFVLTPGMSYYNVLVTLTEPQSTEVTVTIPEGYSLKQMGELLAHTLPNVTVEDWTAVTGVGSPLESHPFIVAAGKPNSVDLEGYLFPDTYRFFVSADAADVAEKMLDTMQLRYEEAAAGNENTELVDLAFTPHQYLTLASIIEKEVRQPATMAMVAGIFSNRLTINMALQADSTVNYITGGDDPSVSYADLEIDSPYNTYKYPGLPPGPISAPGLNALNAVFHDTASDYLYFLTDDEGNVYYAETFDEHQVNRAKYLR